MSRTGLQRLTLVVTVMLVVTSPFVGTIVDGQPATGTPASPEPTLSETSHDVSVEGDTTASTQDVENDTENCPLQSEDYIRGTDDTDDVFSINVVVKEFSGGPAEGRSITVEHGPSGLTATEETDECGVATVQFSYSGATDVAYNFDEFEVTSNFIEVDYNTTKDQRYVDEDQEYPEELMASFDRPQEITVTTLGSRDGPEFPPPEPTGAIVPPNPTDTEEIVYRGDCALICIGEESEESTFYGVPASEVMYWWNLNPTQNISLQESFPDSTLGQQEPEELSDENRTQYMRAQAWARDHTRRDPPDTETWNDNNWDRFGSELDFTKDWSYVLNESDSSDDCDDIEIRPGFDWVSCTLLIQDYHNTIGYLENRTRGFISADKRVNYLPNNGTLEGLVDYRLDHWEDWTEDFKKQRTWFNYYRINKTCLVANSTSCNTDDEGEVLLGWDNKTHTPEIEYEDLNSVTASGTENLTLHSEIQASMELRRYARDCDEWYDEDKDGDGKKKSSAEDCKKLTAWEETLNETVNKEVEYSNEFEVDTLGDKQINVSIERVGRTNGDVEYLFDIGKNKDGSDQDLSPLSWDSIQFDTDYGEVEIQSQWEYVTWRDDRWDVMYNKSEETNKSFAPVATPVFRNLVPTRAPEVRNSELQPAEVIYVNGSQEVESPELPETVNVSVLGENATNSGAGLINSTEEQDTSTKLEGNGTYTPAEQIVVRFQNNTADNMELETRDGEDIPNEVITDEAFDPWEDLKRLPSQRGDATAPRVEPLVPGYDVEYNLGPASAQAAVTQIETNVCENCADNGDHIISWNVRGWAIHPNIGDLIIQTDDTWYWLINPGFMDNITIDGDVSYQEVHFIFTGTPSYEDEMVGSGGVDPNDFIGPRESIQGWYKLDSEDRAGMTFSVDTTAWETAVVGDKDVGGQDFIFLLIRYTLPMFIVVLGLYGWLRRDVVFGKL